MRASFHSSFVDELTKIAISPEAAKRTAEELEKAKREEKGEKPPTWKNKETVTSVGGSASSPEPPKPPSPAVPPSAAVAAPTPPSTPSKPKSFKESAEASEAATKAGIEKLKEKLSLFRKGKELLTEGAGAAVGTGRALGRTRVPMFLKHVRKAALKVPGKALSALRAATELPPVKAPDSEAAQRLFELARRRGTGA